MTKVHALLLRDESIDLIVDALAAYSGTLRDDSRLPFTNRSFAQTLRNRAEAVEMLGRLIEAKQREENLR